jgi:hypothetical protein
VPAASSIARLRRELGHSEYGSAQQNVDELAAPVALSGIVACSRHPMVVLYGLVHRTVGTGVLRFRGYTRPFNHVAIPAQLHVNAQMAYGFLTDAATLEIRSPSGSSLYSEDYPAPPSYESCRGATESVMYAFPSKSPAEVAPPFPSKPASPLPHSQSMIKAAPRRYVLSPERSIQCCLIDSFYLDELVARTLALHDRHG